VFSPWDILLLVLLGLILLRPHHFRLRSPILGVNRPLLMFGLVWLVGMLIGLSKAFLFRYGFTDFRSVVQQSLPAFYLIVTYWLTRSVLVKQKDLELIVRALYLANLMILAKGIVLFVYAMVFPSPVMKGFLSIPIVLYDELTVLTIGMLFAFAKWVSGERLNLLDVVVFGGGVFFSLVSTRRLTWLMMAFNFAIIWYFGRKKNHPLVFRLVAPGLVFCLVGVLLLAVIPQMSDAVGLVVQSFDIYSDVGRAYGGSVRSAELENLFLNLNTQSPGSYMWGMGLGTQWYEFVSMGLPTDVGTTAFIESLLERGTQGWWPYFHVPYISGIYRFGLGGMALLVAAGLFWFFMCLRTIRRIPKQFFPILLVTLVLGIEGLLVIGDSVDSAGPAQFGIWLGFLESVLWLNAVKHKAVKLNILASSDVDQAERCTPV
jgi:hypothetical protein